MGDEVGTLDLFADDPIPTHLDEAPQVLNGSESVTSDEREDEEDVLSVFETNENQLTFVDEWWKAEWQGMPEFTQDDLMPWKSLCINFKSREDMDAFGYLIGQRLTTATRSIWYPQAEIGRIANKRYIDES